MDITTNEQGGIFFFIFLSVISTGRMLLSPSRGTWDCVGYPLFDEAGQWGQSLFSFVKKVTVPIFLLLFFVYFFLLARKRKKQKIRDSHLFFEENR